MITLVSSLLGLGPTLMHRTVGTYADCKCNAPLLILLIAETKYAIENNGQAIKNMKSYDLI